MSSRIDWEKPYDYELDGQVFPWGRPHFHPFPTVGEIVAAAFCPRAAFHLLLNDRDPFIRFGTFSAEVGEGYHKCIRVLKYMVSAGSSFTRDMLQQVAVKVGGANAKYILEYLRKWEKQGCIYNVQKGDRLLFEVTVSSKISFGGGTCFVRGKIDEIDLSNREIVERTIKPLDVAKAQLKDFQLWLLWMILCSISPSQRPDGLKKENFKSYKLFLETPEKKVRVTPKRQYENDLADALKWIRWIVGKNSIWRNVVQASKLRCSPGNKKPGCELPNVCFQRKLKHPQSRREMILYLAGQWKAQVWEQMWRHDLQEYKLVLRDYASLQRQGVVLKAKVVSLSKGQVKLEFASPADALSVLGEGKREEALELIFGTPQLGIRVPVKAEGLEGNLLTLEMDEVPYEAPKPFLMQYSSVAVYCRAPIFLIRRTQRDTFAFTRRGAKSDKDAEKKGTIQLVEAIFGARRIKEG